jgi:hypothetical protein
MTSWKDIPVHGGKVFGAGTTQMAMDDWSDAAREAAAEARKHNAGQAQHHKGEADKHFNAMQGHMRSGNLAGHREARAKWQEHKKLADHHERAAREEQVPSGNGRSMGKSQVSKVTRNLLQGRTAQPTQKLDSEGRVDRTGQKWTPETARQRVGGTYGS